MMFSLKEHRRWTVWIVLLAAALGLTLFGRPKSEDIAAPVRMTPNLRQPSSQKSVTVDQKPFTDVTAAIPRTNNRVLRLPGDQDPFAPKSWTVAHVELPAPPPPTPVAPTVPALPFRYVGILEDAKGNWIVQLERNGQTVIAAKGESIDDLYRLEDLQNHQLIFTYLPLKQRQMLDATEPVIQ